MSDTLVAEANRQELPAARPRALLQGQQGARQEPAQQSIARRDMQAATPRVDVFEDATGITVSQAPAGRI